MAKKTTEPKKKYEESETIVIKRSAINFAPYNPKHHTKKMIEEQKANIKRVGFLGGIIWNKTTSNLIDGHKRIMSLDILNGYDGTPETDYDVKVEMIELDDKTEREQNLYQTKGRTDLDDELVRQMLPDIDYKFAGFDDMDMGYYGVNLAPEITDEVLKSIEATYAPEPKAKAAKTDDINEDDEDEPNAPVELTPEEKKQQVKDAKQKTQERAIEKVENMSSYFTISFDSYANKKAFMMRGGFDPDATFVSGEELSERVEFID